MSIHDIYPVIPDDGETSMTLIRLGVFISSKGKDCIDDVEREVRGERGILNVMGKEFHTIERTSTMRLPVKTLECVMEENATRGKIFRLTTGGDYGHGRRNDKGNPAGLLIHAANYPHQLSGCVAPGKTILATGVGESATAMTEIFNALNGFVPGRKIYLTVKN